MEREVDMVDIVNRGGCALEGKPVLFVGWSGLLVVLMLERACYDWGATKKSFEA